MEGKNEPTDSGMDDSEIIDEGILDAMGISQAAYQEIQTVVGRLPTVHELGTLMAMWRSQGSGGSLLSWLKGQPHASERHDYLTHELEPAGLEVKEPRVRECVDIARSLFGVETWDSDTAPNAGIGKEPIVAHRGDAIYMIGDVSLFFSDSEYGRKYLHLVSDPIKLGNEAETAGYLSMILESLTDNKVIYGHRRIGRGGLFGALVQHTKPYRLGFDILTCREVRLDAFLFGEQGVRFIATIDEPHEDFMLQKLSEARVNCCFLGRVTKGRVLVDDMDFGHIDRYAAK